MKETHCQPASIKHRRVFLRLCILLAFIGICSSGWCSTQDNAEAAMLEGYLKQLGYEGLDFEKTSHIQPFIDARLSNGRKPRLLVDTGWTISSLTPSAAHGLKTLSELGTQIEDRVLGTFTNADFVLMDKLVLGRGAQFSNQPARVYPIKADFVTLPFDGVLGMDFLLRNNCLIDCWKHRLYVRAQPLSAEQAAVMDQSLQLSGFDEVPLHGSSKLNVTTGMNGHPVPLLVDTGAPYNMLDNSQLKELGLTLVHYSSPPTGSYIENDATVSIVGVDGVGLHNARVTKLDSFQMGTRRWKNIAFAVTDLKGWGFAVPGTKHENLKGFLSQAFLARTGALIDVSHGKLWLRATKPPSTAH